MTERYANNFTTVLAAPMLIGDGTAAVSVAAPVSLQGGQFRIAIESELLLVTAGEATTTWTVTRGVEGTTAAAHAGGATVAHVLTAAGLLGAQVFDVRAFGAVVPDTDITPSVRAAILAAESAGGGIVRLPRGRFYIQPQVSGEHCLRIVGSGITIEGAGADLTALVMRTFGGGTPTSSWEVLGGLVHRGYGIHIVGGASAGAIQTGVTIRDLEMDGNATYTGVNTYHANVSTGDGWDITHKGICMGPDRHIDNVRIERVRLHHWRGEIIYGGGSYIGHVLLSDSRLHDTNGDCWSVSAPSRVVGNFMYSAAADCVEDYIYSGYKLFADNEFYGAATGGKGLVSIFSGGSGSAGPVVLERNYLHDHAGAQSCLLVQNTRNVLIRDNLFVDVAQTTNTRAIAVHAPTTTTSQVHIAGNTMLANAANVQTGILVADPASMSAIRATDNYAGVTPTGAAAGKTFNLAYSWDAVPDANGVFVRNVSVGTTYEYTDKAVVSNVLLATTAGTTVVKQRPDRVRGFLIAVYVRVTVASTNVTITASWYDATGLQTAAVQTLASKDVGSYTYAPLFVTATGPNDVQVVVTAGTADRVYVSASIAEA